MPRSLTPWLVFFVSLLTASQASAHEIRPALLEVERHANVCTIAWKQPLLGERTLPLTPRFSSGWNPGGAANETVTASFRSLTWRKEPCTIEDVHELEFEIVGLSRGITDAIAVVDDGVNPPRQFVLTGREDKVRMAEVWSDGGGWLDQVEHGARHIFAGYDHLAFLLALTILCGTWRRVLAGVTGFTIGHTLALAAIALGAVLPRASIIELLVGLSIVTVSAEALNRKRNRSGLAYRYPFIIACLFGLVHGTAYTSALAPFGEDMSQNLAMIASFNLGIELGQLTFLAAVLAIALIGAKAPTMSRHAIRATLYATGILGGYLSADRLIAAI